MKAVADTQGSGTAELKNQLGGGNLLNEVAQAQEVSHDDPIATIKAAIRSPA